MTAEKFTAALPAAYVGTHRCVGKIPMWWAWTVSLSNEVWQHEFMRLFGEEEIPMPRFGELILWDGDLFVIEPVR